MTRGFSPVQRRPLDRELFQRFLTRWGKPLKRLKILGAPFHRAEAAVLNDRHGPTTVLRLEAGHHLRWTEEHTGFEVTYRQRNK